MIGMARIKLTTYRVYFGPGLHLSGRRPTVRPHFNILNGYPSISKMRLFQNDYYIELNKKCFSLSYIPIELCRPRRHRDRGFDIHRILGLYLYGYVLQFFPDTKNRSYKAFHRQD